MFCWSSVTVGHVQVSVAMSRLLLHTEKLPKPSDHVLAQVLYSSVTAANGSLCLKVRLKYSTASKEVFSPGLAFRRKLERMGFVAIPMESSNSVGQ